MRNTLTLAAVVAAFVLAVCAAAMGSTGSVGAAQTARTGYNFTARVTVSLRVHWREWTTRAPCSTWKIASGSSRIRLVGTVSGRYDFGALQRQPGQTWANLWGVGAVSTDPDSSFSRRTLVEQSGVDWGPSCGPFPPRAPVIPRNDCEQATSGTQATRPFRGQVTIHAGRRMSEATLQGLTGPDVGRHRVIVVASMPTTGWYRKCRVHRQAPDLPAPLAALVTEDDVAKLRTLGVGRSYSIDYESGESVGELPCGRPDETGDHERCTGWYSVVIAVRRQT